MNSKFKAIEQELNQKYFERKEVVRGLLVALLSKQHILLLGPPGTGKSALGDDLCKRIGGNYFKKLLSRTSAPEELFGPVSIKAYENDEYRRITARRLPEAEISFIDEIFKCNSAVLNSLLGVLNEREFENNGQILTVPLQFMIGASNELPEDREELGALWDRFLLRFVVKYIKDPRNFENLLLGNSSPATCTTLAKTELEQAQQEAAKVDISTVINQLFVIRDKMQELKIEVSDRRWKQSLNLLRANAWIEGRSVATEEDLEILIYSLWQEPEQISSVKTEIMNLSNPFDREAMDLMDQATELYQNAIQADETRATQAGTEANAKLKAITKKLDELKKAVTLAGKNSARIDETSERVKEFNKEVINKCLGI